MVTAEKNTTQWYDSAKQDLVVLEKEIAELCIELKLSWENLHNSKVMLLGQHLCTIRDKGYWRIKIGHGINNFAEYVQQICSSLTNKKIRDAMLVYDYREKMIAAYEGNKAKTRWWRDTLPPFACLYMCFIRNKVEALQACGVIQTILDNNRVITKQNILHELGIDPKQKKTKSKIRVLIDLELNTLTTSKLNQVYNYIRKLKTK